MKKIFLVVMKFYRDSYEYFISLQNLIFAYVLKLCRDCDKWYWSVSEIQKYSNSTATYLKYYSLSGVIFEDFHYKLSRKKAMYFKKKKKKKKEIEGRKIMKIFKDFDIKLLNTWKSIELVLSIIIELNLIYYHKQKCALI